MARSCLCWAEAMMRVICVNVGPRYGPEWVHRLRGMVARNLKLPHEFCCLTDRQIDGVPCVQATSGLQGWWSKVELFRPGLFPGVNLYLDLDVIVTARIDDMVLKHRDLERVVAPDDFSYSLKTPKKGIGPDTQRLLGGPGTINSSVMIWRGNAGRKVWDEFDESVMEELHGDQNWITRCLWPDGLMLLRDGWVNSFKYHVQRGQKPAPVTVFHGNPKVDELPDFHPLRQAWIG